MATKMPSGSLKELQNSSGDGFKQVNGTNGASANTHSFSGVDSKIYGGRAKPDYTSSTTGSSSGKPSAEFVGTRKGGGDYTQATDKGDGYGKK
jgi:hypothetical protein